MLFKNHRIERKLTETKSSTVYKTDENKIIKVEKPGFTYLKNEIKIRKLLEKNDGILSILDFGVCQTERYIVYRYIEKTLYKNILPISEVYSLALEMIKIIETIHSQGIMHCDISAANILYDTKNRTFFLNDFGHSKHITFCMDEKNTGNMLGCPLFCSENIHMGYDYAPRDDFISLAYVLIYSIKNILPWSGKKNMAQIYLQKKTFRENIWEYDFIPHEIKIFSNYCFHLKINERPNYEILKKLFTDRNELSIQT